MHFLPHGDHGVPSLERVLQEADQSLELHFPVVDHSPLPPLPVHADSREVLLLQPKGGHQLCLHVLNDAEGGGLLLGLRQLLPERGDLRLGREEDGFERTELGAEEIVDVLAVEEEHNSRLDLLQVLDLQHEALPLPSQLPSLALELLLRLLQFVHQLVLPYPRLLQLRLQLLLRCFYLTHLGNPQPGNLRLRSLERLPRLLQLSPQRSDLGPLRIDSPPQLQRSLASMHGSGQELEDVLEV
mmetsp:Transcript_47059/g.147344  ORF Transcript_47059/g.147344 Transcript_47059/m.147344 type:complete len:242 (-) Transcript_47059:271-996(-)